MPVSVLSVKKARTFVNKALTRLMLHAARQGLQLTSRWQPELAAQKAETLFLTPRPLPIRARQEKVLNRGSQGVVQVGEDLVRLWRWGSGPGVLLVHGWSGRGAQFADWVDPLVEAGFQVTLFDAPSHGRSTGDLASVVHFAQAIEEIVRQYGPFAAVIGHSMGGAAALVAAARGLPIQQLVTLAAPGDLEVMMQRAFQGLMGLEPKLNPLIVRRLEQRFGLGMAELNPAHLAAKITLPWLLLHDLDDDEIPWSEAEALARLAPNSQLISSKGLGHYRILRDPGVRRQVSAFLQGENPQPLTSPEMDLILKGLMASS